MTRAVRTRRGAPSPAHPSRAPLFFHSHPHVHAHTSQVWTALFFAMQHALLGGQEACRRALCARALRTRHRTLHHDPACLSSPEVPTLIYPDPIPLCSMRGRSGDGKAERRRKGVAAVQVRAHDACDSNAPLRASDRPPLAAQPSFPTPLRSHSCHACTCISGGRASFFAIRQLVTGKEACRRVLCARALRMRHRTPLSDPVCFCSPDIPTLIYPHA